MRTTSASTRYGDVAQSFHWLVAALIVVQFLRAPIPENLPRDIHLDPPFGMDKLGLLARHESFGMTVLMLMVARALWRWRNAPPDLPETMKPAARFLARTTHIAFYVILIAMPLSGWRMTSSEGQFCPLVRNMDLAESYWSKRPGIRPVPRDARYAESGPVLSRLVSCGCRPQTSFLEQGRNAKAHASFPPFREMKSALSAIHGVAESGRTSSGDLDETLALLPVALFTTPPLFDRRIDIGCDQSTSFCRLIWSYS